ncbi:hypothetical protein ACWEIJ_07410 [Lentzea sp. NPDC004789]
MSADPEQPVPPGITDAHDSSGFVIGDNAQQHNNYNFYLQKLAGTTDIEWMNRLLAAQEKHLASQQEHIEELRERQVRELGRLEEQFSRVRDVFPAVVQVARILQEDRARAAAEQAVLNEKLDHVVNENQHLRQEHERLTEYIRELEVEYARAKQALVEVHVEQRFLVRIEDALRTRWIAFSRGQAEPEPPQRTTARFALPTRSDDEWDVLTYCRQALDEVHAIQVEVQQALEELAADLFGTAAAETEAKTRSEAEITIRRKLAQAEEKIREQERTLEREKRKHARPKSPAAAVRTTDVISGVLPGLGLFLLGVVIREVPRMPALSEGQKLFFTALTLLLLGLPVWTLVKWARSAGRPAPELAAAICLFCVVAGYFSWVLVVLPALAALTSVLTTRKAGGEFAFMFVGVAIAGVAFPKVTWWSWTGFHWLAVVLG